MIRKLGSQRDLGEVSFGKKIPSIGITGENKIE